MIVGVEVDYDSAVPPSRQIANELRSQISSGQLPPGARLPSIAAMMQTYGVARNTARRAIQFLVDEGLVEVIQGWGSFVRT